jgi:hypothetical protein
MMASRFGKRRFVALAALAFGAAIALSCGSSSKATVEKETPAATATEAPSNTVWLCKPGLPNNPCESDLTATIINVDGSRSVEDASLAQDQPIDCFYVYPTVSAQKTALADLTIDPEETSVAIAQASRFSQVCKVYAPMYRQVTRSGLEDLFTGKLTDATEDFDIAYSDVLSAWQDYLAHYNNGRGVVLISHSQGTIMLTRLVKEQIDPNPEMRKMLVSALLIGGNIHVAKGQDVGGEFQNVPACRSTTQNGCVVAYSSFAETPPADAMFGRVDVGVNPIVGPTAVNLEVLCVNPAAPEGGRGSLLPYSPRTGAAEADMPWVSRQGQYTAECESADGANWLQVDSNSAAGDQRKSFVEVLGPTWGLHLVDVNIALGNLVDLVRREADAYTK